jgi:hypothetical protein
MNYQVWPEGRKSSGPNLQRCRAVQEAISGGSPPPRHSYQRIRVEIGMLKLVIRLSTLLSIVALVPLIGQSPGLKSPTYDSFVAKHRGWTRLR